MTFVCEYASLVEQRPVAHKQSSRKGARALIYAEHDICYFLHIMKTKTNIIPVMKYSLLLILLLLLPCGAVFSAETGRDPKEAKIMAEVAPVLANLKSMIAQKNYSDALKDAKDLLKKTEYSLSPTHPVLDDVYNILSTLYYYQSDYQNAAYYMEKSLTIEKTSVTDPEKMGKTIDLLSMIYQKLGKENRVKELKIMKAVVFRPMFAQPITEKEKPSESATVEVEAEKIDESAEDQQEPVLESGPEVDPLSVPPTTEFSSVPVAENMNASAKKVLWFYGSFMLVLVAFGLLRKRRESLEKEKEVELPEIKKQPTVSFSIARPEVIAEPKIPETKTEVREEPIVETAVPIESEAVKTQVPEETVPSADERWKEYQQRFSERQARIVLGIEEDASWDEIQNRYRDLMKTYDTKNMEYISSELQKTAEFRREKIVQAFGILKSKQTFPKRVSSAASKPEFVSV